MSDSSIPQTSPEFPTSEKSSQLEPDSLNEQHMAAVELLAMGKSYAAVAKSLEIDRKTLFNWRMKPAFQLAVKQRHSEIWGDAVDRLQMLIAPALEVLSDQMSQVYDQTRHRAAVSLIRLAHMQKLLEAPNTPRR